MAESEPLLMPPHDCFQNIAHFYDGLMYHVDYDRWYAVVTTIADMLPRPFIHVDTACGTCRLVKRVRELGWTSLGVDLSLPMLRAGRKEAPAIPVAVGDLRHLPLTGGADYVTCLFDSINFLPCLDDIEQTFREVYGALRDDGLFYFDIVTERMVTEHFAGQSWTEHHGRLTTNWKSDYCPNTGLSETRIQVNQSAEGTILEYMYEPGDIEAAVKNAGFRILGIYDAETWKRPRKKKTIRMDFVAAKNPSRARIKSFKGIQKEIRAMLV